LFLQFSGGAGTSLPTVPEFIPGITAALASPGTLENSSTDLRVRQILK
jgi:hypothetical protein